MTSGFPETTKSALGYIEKEHLSSSNPITFDQIWCENDSEISADLHFPKIMISKSFEASMFSGPPGSLERKLLFAILATKL